MLLTVGGGPTHAVLPAHGMHADDLPLCIHPPRILVPQPCELCPQCVAVRLHARCEGAPRHMNSPASRAPDTRIFYLQVLVHASASWSSHTLPAALFAAAACLTLPLGHPFIRRFSARSPTCAPQHAESSSTPTPAPQPPSRCHWRTCPYSARRPQTSSPPSRSPLAYPASPASSLASLRALTTMRRATICESTAVGTDLMPTLVRRGTHLAAVREMRFHRSTFLFLSRLHLSFAWLSRATHMHA